LRLVGYNFSRTPNRKVLGFSYSKWRVRLGYMKRRAFVTLLEARQQVFRSPRLQQSDRILRIGWLISLITNDPEDHRRGAAFRQKQLGRTNGRNVPTEYPE
jgi:hypothetical protein